MTEIRTNDENGPRPAEARAERFQAVREAHRNELAEDYVELIAELIAQFGEARPVDLAARMGVTAPTVAKTLDRLAREGLVARAPYRSVFLTPDGARLAESCLRRHEIVVRFLIRLGLDPETAEKDAEGIEHHVSDRTLELFRSFAECS
ncbi:manganese-binding transcriptional regulator MntR [Tabrizicola oligotrophica]|uniref:Transcriptional regulator MntR n=1 Tax=Tabrizicola oligotrophica TaxID=2710650 RepID=A0A6M0QQG3_9RHOB|nr:manganese-binding transcriptional regulator MntR [Tabrizicola oligotrophica]NEY89735.1 manganese-binding transcriptional regulator MntR [Tabrizicola oligotrophica]